MQKINESGTILANVEKNVVFTKRILNSVIIESGNIISVEYTNISEEGEKRESVNLDSSHFAKAENCLWEAIDDVRKEENE